MGHPPVDSRWRVSYLVDDPQSASVEATDEGKTIQISNLLSAKHVRVVVPGGRWSSGGVHITWASKRVLDTPFDLPVQTGLHVDTLPQGEENWAGLKSSLLLCGIELQAGYFHASNYDTYFDYSGPRPSFPCLEDFGLQVTPDLVAVTVTYGYSDRLPGLQPEDAVIEVYYDWSDRTETVVNMGAKTEVGVLSLDETINDPADQVVHGRVRDLAKNEVSSPIMYHHVPVYRHVSESRVVDVRFSEPSGLHFNLLLGTQTVTPKPQEPAACRLYALLDLPKNIFVDQYQLQDLPRFDPPSELLGAWGETDLEAPEWLVTQGSQALIRLGSEHSGLERNSTYEVPLHFRYVEPTDTLAKSGTLPAPLVFWACQEPMPLEHIPGLSFESIFPDDTSYHFLDTNSVAYSIPAISASDEDRVFKVTAYVVFLGSVAIFVAIVLKLIRTRGQPTKLKSD